jgi:hypothetical protein
MPPVCRTACLALALGLAFLARPAQAQSTGSPPSGVTTEASPSPAIEIELNKVEPLDNACRIYLVLQSTMPADLDALLLELVSFDAEGVISQRVAVDLAPLRSRKLTVKTFDVPDTSCERVSRLLVNDALECRSPDGPINTCLDLIRVTARGDVELWK